jgi:hypothetical protein
VFVSNDYGKTFRSISSNLPTDRPGSAYVIAEDPVNPNLLYVGTEVGVFASLNKGTSWFRLQSGLPTVPVYDLKIHPRDRELIAGTHGRGILVLDVAPLQQMSAEVLARPAYLFQPAVGLQYGQPPAPSEPRAHRGWKADGGPSGAVISYRLAGSTDSVRVAIVSIAGDTVARLTGPGTPGLNRVEWNFAQNPTGQVNLSGRGGRGGGAASDVTGFPPGFIPRPAESSAGPDSSGSPTAQARALAAAGAGGGGRGGRGGGGGGGGGGGRGGFGGFTVAPQVTADYRVVLDVAGQKMTQTLRVVVVPPGAVSVR